jgi:hypothetical protein
VLVRRFGIVKKTWPFVVVVGLSVLAGSAQARLMDTEPGEAATEPFETDFFEWDHEDTLAQQEPAPPAEPAPLTTPPPTPPAAATPPVATPPAAAASPETTPPAAPGAATEPAPASVPPAAEDQTPTPTEDGVPPEGEDATVEDEFSIGDIPVVETIELNLDMAKKALDTYVLVRDKYKDAALENYENLQDFVDQSAQGKDFEADVKAAAFKDVTEWNTTITTLSFAYDNSINDQTAEVNQQITELKADTEMAEDMKQRMITALTSLIPSPNNKQVVQDLIKDAAYADKLKLLETEQE